MKRLKDRIANGIRLQADNFITSAKGKRLAPLSDDGLMDVYLADAWESGCLDVTRLLTEHPKEWDGPCECQTCVEDSNR